MDMKAPAPHNFGPATGDFYSAQNFKPKVNVNVNQAPSCSNMNNPYGTMTRALKSMSNFSSEAPVYFESYYELNPPGKKNSAVLIQTEIHNGTNSSSNINASEKMAAFQ